MGIDNCGGLGPLVKVIRRGIIPIFQIGIPILLIILGTKTHPHFTENTVN